MKHAAVAIVTLALAACQPGPDTALPGGENSEIISGMYDAFARGDVPAVAAAMAPDIEWNVAESYIYAEGNPYRGPAAVVEGPFARIGAEWTDFRLTVDEIIESGDRVVVLGRYTGRYKATRAPIDAQFAHVWRVKKGKAVSFQQYTDTLQFAKAVGAKSKAKPVVAKAPQKSAAKSAQPAAKTPAKKKPAKKPKSGR